MFIAFAPVRRKLLAIRPLSVFTRRTDSVGRESGDATASMARIVKELEFQRDCRQNGRHATG